MAHLDMWSALVRGVVELEPTDRGVRLHRLPERARAQCPDPQLLMAEGQPAGARIEVVTTATVIELDVIATKRLHLGLPPRPDGVYELEVDGQVVASATAAPGDTITTDLATGTVDARQGDPATVRFDGLPPGEKHVRIWLPHNETTELVDLRADAAPRPAPAAARTWLHHGSSISQGSNAEVPTGTWPVVAARRAGVGLVNLGFSGSALLDPFTARTMRDLPADLLSVKIGINVVNADLMRLRAFGPAVHGFLDTLREGHPDSPLAVVTPLWCGIHEQTPGPGAFDVAAMQEGRVGFVATGDPAAVAAGALTLQVIRAELGRVVRQRQATDPHLHLVDGLGLFGEADAAEHPLPDALHPDAATHLRVGEKFAEQVFGSGGAFA